MNSSIVIVSAARTPMGAFQGHLSAVTAPDLGATTIKAVIARSGIDKSQIDEVLMGNVLTAGVGRHGKYVASSILLTQSSIRSTLRAW